MQLPRLKINLNKDDFINIFHNLLPFYSWGFSIKDALKEFIVLFLDNLIIKNIKNIKIIKNYL